MELQALATEYAGQTRPWIMKRTEELRPDLQRRLNYPALRPANWQLHLSGNLRVAADSARKCFGSNVPPAIRSVAA